MTYTECDHNYVAFRSNTTLTSISVLICRYFSKLKYDVIMNLYHINSFVFTFSSLTFYLLNFIMTIHFSCYSGEAKTTNS